MCAYFSPEGDYENDCSAPRVAGTVFSYIFFVVQVTCCQQSCSWGSFTPYLFPYCSVQFGNRPLPLLGVFLCSQMNPRLLSILPTVCLNAFFPHPVLAQDRKLKGLNTTLKHYPLE